MIEILKSNPLLLLFLVAAVGYPIGKIKIYGSSLGVAAVLFVGLAFGALDPDLKLPEIVYVMGLAIFVYTVGLSSGPAFLASLKREGIKSTLLVAGVLGTATMLAIAAHHLLHLTGPVTAGLFTGSLTVTPALAAALDTIKEMAPKELLDHTLAEPVAGYALTYPMGVIGMILAMAAAQKLWSPDYVAEAKSMRGVGAVAEQLRNCTIRITKPEAWGISIDELHARFGIVFGRIKHGRETALATPQAHLEAGDLVTAVGTREELERVVDFLGERSSLEIDLDRSTYDYRRIFLSNPKLAGRRIRDLDLKRFDARITRVRRGDADFLPGPDLVLELGDRVRVLSPRKQMEPVTRYFGDSYRSVSEIDILTFSLGVAVGLLLGAIPIPLPGGIELKLGFAGGPLIVALILGVIGRTGEMVWTLPYSANMTLRQIGLVLFLAGVGTRSGYVFLSTLSQHGGFGIFCAGAFITLFTAVTFLWIGHRILKIPLSLLFGMLAGLQTQSALLGYSLEQTRNELPNVGYASIYPVAVIIKIFLVQLILNLYM